MTPSLVPQPLVPVVEAVRGPSRPARAGRWLTAIAVFIAVIELFFGLSAPDFVSGLALGSLYGVIGVGIVLIYRTSRIINFAAGAVGAVPAVIALVLVLEYGVNYLVALPIVLVGGPLLGLLTDLVMRRFDAVPRLIATVMTIAVAQSLAVLGFFIPVWLGQKATDQGTTVTTPWQHLVWHTSRGQPLLTGNEIAAFLTVAVVTIGLAVFLRFTRLGIALRASAENADRALLLGIPVRRVSAAAWALAGLLAALAIYVQAPLIGTPNDATLGPRHPALCPGRRRGVAHGAFRRRAGRGDGHRRAHHRHDHQLRGQQHRLVDHGARHLGGSAHPAPPDGTRPRRRRGPVADGQAVPADPRPAAQAPRGRRRPVGHGRRSVSAS